MQDCYTIMVQIPSMNAKLSLNLHHKCKLQSMQLKILNPGLVGKDQYLELIQKRIQTNKVDFLAPIKQIKLPTFELAVNVRKVKVKVKEVTA